MVFSGFFWHFPWYQGWGQGRAFCHFGGFSHPVKEKQIRNACVPGRKSILGLLSIDFERVNGPGVGENGPNFPGEGKKTFLMPVSLDFGLEACNGFSPRHAKSSQSHRPEDAQGELNEGHEDFYREECADRDTNYVVQHGQHSEQVPASCRRHMEPFAKGP